MRYMGCEAWLLRCLGYRGGRFEEARGYLRGRVCGDDRGFVT